LEGPWLYGFPVQRQNRFDYAGLKPRRDRRRAKTAEVRLKIPSLIVAQTDKKRRPPQ
jgi:hypothetical protein